MVVVKASQWEQQEREASVQQADIDGLEAAILDRERAIEKLTRRIQLNSEVMGTAFLNAQLNKH